MSWPPPKLPSLPHNTLGPFRTLTTLQLDPVPLRRGEGVVSAHCRHGTPAYVPTTYVPVVGCVIRHISGGKRLCFLRPRQDGLVSPEGGASVMSNDRTTPPRHGRREGG
ncbi:hypothetical protein IF2G_08502 [Cordyceps javanica]|nr:hypothetical protein IF2G_08502 [Cordyceps javanica]